MVRNAAQSIPNQTTTKIDLDAEDYDVGGIGDITTDNRVEIKRAGKYLVIASNTFNIDDGEYIKTSVYDGTNTLIWAGTTYSGGIGDNSTTTCSAVLDLAAGSYLQLQAGHSDGGALNTATGNREPFLCVTEIR